MIRCFILIAACIVLHGANYPLLGLSEFSPLPIVQADTLHWYLKWGVTSWAVLELNSVLNRWAENRWLWRSDSNAWNWKNEIAVVTGGSQGIGACVVKTLVSHGISCAVLDVVPLSADLTKGVGYLLLD
jgi:all-trans-retinol dehydrogenase (NAD+)